MIYIMSEAYISTIKKHKSIPPSLVRAPSLSTSRTLAPIPSCRMQKQCSYGSCAAEGLPHVAEQCQVFLLGTQKNSTVTVCSRTRSRSFADWYLAFRTSCAQRSATIPPIKARKRVHPPTTARGAAEYAVLLLLLLAGCCRKAVPYKVQSSLTFRMMTVTTTTTTAKLLHWRFSLLPPNTVSCSHIDVGCENSCRC